MRAANGVKGPHLQLYEVLEKMKEFESNPQVKYMLKAIRQYMHMVVAMGLYIRAVRTGNSALHLSALEEFVKLNYARMIPIYLAEMSQLERTYPEIWS